MSSEDRPQHSTPNMHQKSKYQHDPISEMQTGQDSTQKQFSPMLKTVQEYDKYIRELHKYIADWAMLLREMNENPDEPILKKVLDQMEDTISQKVVTQNFEHQSPQSFKSESSARKSDSYCSFQLNTKKDQLADLLVQVGNATSQQPQGSMRKQKDPLRQNNNLNNTQVNDTDIQDDASEVDQQIQNDEFDQQFQLLLSAQRNVTELQQLNQQLVQAAKSHHEQLEQHKQSINCMKRELENKQEDFNKQIEKQKENFINQINLLKSEKQMQQISEQDIQKLQTEFDELKIKYKTLQEAKQSQDKDLAAKQVELLELTDFNKQIKLQYANLNNELEDLKKSYQEVTVELKANQVQLEQANRFIVTLQNQMVDQQSKLSQKYEADKQITQIIKSEQQGEEDEAVEEIQYHDKLQQLDHQHKIKLEEIVKDNQAKLEQLNNTIDNLKKELEQITNQFAQQQQEINNLDELIQVKFADQLVQVNNHEDNTILEKISAEILQISVQIGTFIQKLQILFQTGQAQKHDAEIEKSFAQIQALYLQDKIISAHIQNTLSISVKKSILQYLNESNGAKNSQVQVFVNGNLQFQEAQFCFYDDVTNKLTINAPECNIVVLQQDNIDSEGRRLWAELLGLINNNYSALLQQQNRRLQTLYQTYVTINREYIQDQSLFDNLAADVQSLKDAFSYEGIEKLKNQFTLTCAQLADIQKQNHHSFLQRLKDQRQVARGAVVA